MRILLALLFFAATPAAAQIFPARVKDKDVKDNLYYLYEQIQRAINGGLSGAYISITAPFAGDVTGPYTATVVGNDSHSHTAATAPGTAAVITSTETIVSQLTALSAQVSTAAYLASTQTFTGGNTFVGVSTFSNTVDIYSLAVTSGIFLSTPYDYANYSLKLTRTGTGTGILSSVSGADNAIAMTATSIGAGANTGLSIYSYGGTANTGLYIASNLGVGANNYAIKSLSEAQSSFAGSVAATSFSGDGSALTGVGDALLAGYQTWTGSNTFVPSAYNEFEVRDYITFKPNGKVGVGYKAGAVSGNYNTAYGAYASSSTTGANNTAIGYLALEDNKTGTNNVAVGFQAGKDRTASTTNIDIGFQAGLTSTSGSYNTNIGYQAGGGSSGNYNVSLGYNTGVNTVGDSNVYIGANVTKPVLYGEVGDSSTLNLANVLVADIATGTAAFRAAVTAPSFVGDGSALTNLPMVLSGVRYSTDTVSMSLIDLSTVTAKFAAHDAFISTATTRLDAADHNIAAQGLALSTAAYNGENASFNSLTASSLTITGGSEFRRLVTVDSPVSGAYSPNTAMTVTAHSLSSGFNSGTGLTATSTGTYYNTAIYGYTNSNAVVGADQIGVSGYASSNVNNVYGVKGNAVNSVSGRNAYGVYGEASGAGNKYAGYFSGQVVATSSITTNVGFYGDGSALTNLPVGLFELIDGNLTPRAVPASDINFEISDGNIRPL